MGSPPCSSHDVFMNEVLPVNILPCVPLMISSKLHNENPMFSAPMHATRAYRDIGVETGAAAAAPVQLILMLYDGGIDALTQALAQVQPKDRNARQAAITRALRIVDEGLLASLDDSGGGITQQLRELYGYMTRRMLAASLGTDPAPLAEVRTLLKDLRGAWNELAQLPAGGGVGSALGGGLGSLAQAAPGAAATRAQQLAGVRT